jgi:nitroreductase
MSKLAKTSIEINHLLAERWSPRAFKNEPIPDDSIIKMLEATRWAPSSMNDQPWQIIVGQNHDETYQKIFETLVEFNQQWAKNAPVLMLCCGNKMRGNNEPNAAYKYDVGQAIAHLSIQAMSENIYVHQMGGFSKEKAAEIFQFPSNIEALSIVAIGYLGDPEILHPRMQVSEKAARERKPLKDFVFQNKFGETFNLIK